MSYVLTADDIVKGQVFLMNKPYQWTSFDLVKKVRYLLRDNLNLKKVKVGHAGTLDPLATGLMVICTGKATKKIPELIENTKEYLAEIKLGATTPSYDLETGINEHFDYLHITEQMVKDVLNHKFKGKIHQIPPLFSAKKVNGKRAYDLARKGEKMILDPILIEITDIELVKFDLPLIQVYVKCSKGTYIRSLAMDIGLALNSGAHLVDLKRTRIGKHNLNEAITIEEFGKILQNKTI